ncbi:MULTISPECIES: sulfotransferase family protein [unclassified Coleofasciculus]|uniref:sulfotransferase family protein n=1 Tax=unclassified Coleofasciculus TaxID=2692782 RepID=UPI001881CBCC|nr:MULTISPECIES: sulfotransferase [unclassified Coleofasciculus]MBE9125724.1 sulfotransferase [Coleofasciculus sp. LEGE 07081]MBE9147212.1 sulfotransferase [Coleofasciculus sp. LEGE 07092]
MINALKPWFRQIKYSWLHYSADYKARHSRSDETTLNFLSPVFLMGCGRSGTTILGDILARHPKVRYLFEPYHLWAAIEPKTDVLNLYYRIDAHLLMNVSHCNEESKVRFNHLIIGFKPNINALIILEKTPFNAMRIGYLKALAPTAKFIHLVRDGVDVSCSIERIASTNSYKIAGKPQLNQWWGVENYKWKALARDGASAGYYPKEVHQLQDHRSKGAYEWLVSLGEVDSWREHLGHRLYEITYNQLTLHPEATLHSLCQFLELDSPSNWLNEVTQMIHPAQPTLGNRLSLPSPMCDTFNHYQERFGFSNRAIPLKVL